MTGHEQGVPIQHLRRDKRLDPKHRMRLDAAIHMQGRGWVTGRDGGRPWTLSRTNRVFACFGALVILLLISPVLLVLALAIRLTSPGPVMFVQKRTGYRGRMFGMYKFPHHGGQRRGAQGVAAAFEQTREGRDRLQDRQGPADHRHRWFPAAHQASTNCPT